MSFYSSYSGWLMRVYRWIWLGRVESQPPSMPPGCVVFAAHYNGAVDGMTYGSGMPGCVGVVSVQWHRTLLGRLLLPGIAVQRAKDGKGASNLAAFRRMLGAVAAGERLLFFPEGTSRLGKERLPIGRGTLLLLRGLRSEKPPVPVFFAAAHYHDPTRWRSNVSVAWVGPVELPVSADDDDAWVTENLLKAQAAAYAMPVPPSYRWVPVAAIIALPFLPFWGLASRLALRIADGDNVIALWKFLIGVPVTVVAAAGYSVLCGVGGWPVWLPLVSLAGGSLLWNR